ncbi:aliphatic sulfonates ABC transporter substrate-binding protein, partial [bacterium]|nr:aliphatic sulfonates ABC transporter substrate-binding protein [bacterium]
MKKLIAAVALFVFGASSAAFAAPEAAKEVQIGYQAASTMILLTKAKGYYDEEFAKQGLKVKYNLFLSGPPMIEALAGDRLDFVHTGD